MAEYTAQYIEKAAAALGKLRPAYAGIIDFYERIFKAREESAADVLIEPIRVPPEILEVKRKGKLPLIGAAEFVIDKKASESLLKKICDIARDSNPDLAASASAAAGALDEGRLNPELLFSALLNEDDAFFEDLEKGIGIGKAAAAFFAYNSIQPSIRACAARLAALLEESAPWEKGYCPICGNPPGLSVLEGEGGRFLICCFCEHKWPVRRIFCPFCENADAKTLHYFHTEEEKEYRVDVCDACGKYLKTVDARKMDRLFYPSLEQAATLHLDIMARDKGLAAGAQPRA